MLGARSLLALAPAAAQKLDGFDTFANQALRDWKCDGFAIAVIQDGKVILFEGLRAAQREEESAGDHQDFVRDWQLDQIFHGNGDGDACGLAQAGLY